MQRAKKILAAVTSIAVLATSVSWAGLATSASEAYTGTLVTEETEWLRGDTDGDWVYSEEDAVLALQSYVSVAGGGDATLEGDPFIRADVDEDGEITISDAEWILNAYVVYATSGELNEDENTVTNSTEDEDEETTEAETEAEDEETTEAETEAEDEDSTEAETEAEEEDSTEAETEAEDEDSTEAETEAEDEETTEAETEAEDEETTEAETEAESEDSTEAETEAEDEETTEAETEAEDEETETTTTAEAEEDESDTTTAGVTTADEEEEEEEDEETETTTTAEAEEDESDTTTAGVTTADEEEEDEETETTTTAAEEEEEEDSTTTAAEEEEEEDSTTTAAEEEEEEDSTTTAAEEEEEEDSTTTTAEEEEEEDSTTTTEEETTTTTEEETTTTTTTEEETTTTTTEEEEEEHTFELAVLDTDGEELTGESLAYICLDHYENEYGGVRIYLECDDTYTWNEAAGTSILGSTDVTESITATFTISGTDYDDGAVCAYAYFSGWFGTESRDWTMADQDEDDLVEITGDGTYTVTWNVEDATSTGSSYLVCICIEPDTDVIDTFTTDTLANLEITLDAVTVDGEDYTVTEDPVATKGDTVTLSSLFDDDELDNADVTYDVSGATLDEDNTTVTLDTVGTATITATYTYDDVTYTDSASIVVQNDIELILDEEYTLNDEATVSVTIEGEEIDLSDVTITVEDEDIATYEDGTLTFVGVGTTTVTATYGNSEASVTIIVKDHEFELSYENLTTEAESLSYINTAYYGDNTGVTRIYLRDDWTGADCSVLDDVTTVETSITATFTVSGLDGNYDANDEGIYGYAYFIGSFGTESCWDLIKEYNEGVSVVEVTGDGTYTVEWDVASATNTGSEWFLCIVIEPADGIENFTTHTFDTLEVTLDAVTVDGVDYDANTYTYSTETATELTPVVTYDGEELAWKNLTVSISIDDVEVISEGEETGNDTEITYNYDADTGTLSLDDECEVTVTVTYEDKYGNTYEDSITFTVEE